MFTPWLRLIIIAIAVVLGARAFRQGDWLAGILCCVVCVLMIWGYFRYGTVWLAFRAARKGKGQRAARLLAKVSRPEWLKPVYRAYYHWIKGAVAADQEDFDLARVHLLRALEEELKSSTNRSIVACSLAELACKTGDLEQAQEFLERAKQEPHGEAVDKMIERLENSLQERAEGPRP